MAVPTPQTRQPTAWPSHMRPSSSPANRPAPARVQPPNTASSDHQRPLFRVMSASSLSDQAASWRANSSGGRGAAKVTKVPRPNTSHSNPARLDYSEDVAALVDFFRNQPPPSSNIMSRPYDRGSNFRRQGWIKVKRLAQKSRAQTRKTPQARLPNSAVYGVTRGGHRHIAIAIPFESSPFGTMPRSQYPVFSSDGTQTYLNEKGVLTVLRPMAESFEPPVTTAPSGPLPPLPYATLQRGSVPQGAVSRASPQGQRVAYQNNGFGHRRLPPVRSMSQLVDKNRNAWDAQRSQPSTRTPRPRSPPVPQRAAFPPQMASYQPHRALQQAVSMDGMIAQFINHEEGISRSQYRLAPQPMHFPVYQRQNATPTPCAPVKKRAAYDSDSSDAEEYVFKPSQDGWRCSDTPLLSQLAEEAFGLGDTSPPPTPRSRRDIVKDRKKRDLEAAKNARQRHRESAGGWVFPSPPSSPHPDEMRRTVVRQTPVVTRPQSPADECALGHQESLSVLPIEAVPHESLLDTPLPREASHENTWTETESHLSFSSIMVVLDERPLTVTGRVDGLLRRHLSTSTCHGKSPSQEIMDFDTGVSTPVSVVASQAAPQQNSTALDRTSLTRRREWSAARERNRQLLQESSAASQAPSSRGSNVPRGPALSSTAAEAELFRLFEAYRNHHFHDIEGRLAHLERNGDIWLRALMPMLESMNKAIAVISASSPSDVGKREDQASIIPPRKTSSDQNIVQGPRESEGTLAKTPSLSRQRLLEELKHQRLLTLQRLEGTNVDTGNLDDLKFLEPLVSSYLDDTFLGTPLQQLSTAWSSGIPNKGFDSSPGAASPDEQPSTNPRDHHPGDAMSAPWIFVCPTSRGIGHALTRRLLQSTSLPILATTRSADPAAAKAALLDGLPGDTEDIAPRLSLVRCDVTDETSVAAAAARAAELFPGATHHLRLACAMPGVLHAEKSPAQIDAGRALETFRVNTLGPLLLVKHFAGLLPRRAVDLLPAPAADEARLPPHATWLTMGARVGSITDNRTGGWYSYRASKTAVASVTRSLDIFLRARCGDKALAVAYHPGTVRTDLSRDYWAGVKEGKLFSPEYAAERLLAVVTGLKLEQRGRCWAWDNEEVPP
ncbi:hypothetical protein S40293_01390 [Stachybotrys chartarum IBT 40293]|nr:hypothetical protein S40293_01390 [Stachybotrys chartarum IBT 40293]